MRRFMAVLLVCGVEAWCAGLSGGVAQAVVPNVSGEQQPLELVSIVPARNELNVPRAATISVTFDMDMDVATLHDNNIVVTARSTGHHPGTVYYDHGTRTATYAPDRHFVPGDIVSVTVTTRVESTDGNCLNSAHSWSFTVTVSGGLAVFDPAAVYPTGLDPWSIRAIDLDGDDDLDLAVGSAGDGAVEVHLNDGTASFAFDSSYFVGYSPFSVVSGDFDTDGDIDLAAAIETSEYFGWVAVLLNKGDGIFSPAVNYATTGASVAIFPADVDGDGDIDLVSLDGLVSNRVSVLMNAGDGSFSLDTSYPAGDSPSRCPGRGPRR